MVSMWSRILVSIVVFLFFASLAVSATTTYSQPSSVRLIISYDPRLINIRTLMSIGGTVIYKASVAPIMIIEIPDTSITLLRRVPGIIHVSLDREVHVMAQTIPWGVDYVNAPEAWSTTDGGIDVDGDGNRDVEVAVIDTGVDYDHPDLADNIAWCVSTLGGTLSSNCYDGNGHGTHVIGTVAAINNDIGVVGVAPNVEIYAIKALNDQGSGTYSDIIMAIDVAIKGPDGVVDADGDGVIVGDPDDDAPEVISMSLGGSSDVAELHDIIVEAYNWGITIVAAAGNEGASSPAYPAAYPEVIAVGAIDSDENVPWWSNRYPEVAAPGVDILSTYPDDSYETLSGTSMATPHVSATVALIQAARLANGLSPLPPGSEDDTSQDTVRGILHTTAKDLGSSGYDPYYGYGAIQADAAVQAAIGGGEEQPPEQPVVIELLYNGGFDTGPDGWSFYPGDYMDEAYWYDSVLGRSGVVEITGDIPRWSWWVKDYAYIGQDISVPSNATSGTITIEYYAAPNGPDVDVVVVIYDRNTDSTVWYEIVDANYNQWSTLTITVPSDVISDIRGGDYLFLVGLRVNTFTLWWSESASIYFDSVSFTVETQ